MHELTIIMPCYNEEEIIGEVLERLYLEVKKHYENFRICVYDDGSTDSSVKKIEEITRKYAKIILHKKQNSGHGPTLVSAYLENLDSKWIFQLDSDGEIPATNFSILWEKRNFDVVIGKRINRNPSLSRHLITKCLRILITFLYGKGIHDVNSPCRLMKTSSLRNLLFHIPLNSLIPNTFISGLAILFKLNVKEVDIPNKTRSGLTP